MFEVLIEGDTLRVYHNQKLVIAHTPGEPFAWAGKSKWNISEFNIADDVRDRSPLTHAQYDANLQVLRLSGGTFSLSFHISDHDGCLRLVPQRSTTGLNRLRLHFPAAPGQCVYGGGAQYHKLDCRGQRIPLWVREHRLPDRGRPNRFVGYKGLSGHASYFPIPAFFTQDWIWHYFDCSAVAVFDFKSPKRHAVELFELPSAILIGAEESPLDVQRQLTRFSGRQPMLPHWTISGACLEVSGGSHHVAERLEKMADVSVSSLLIADWSGTKDTPGGPKPFFDWFWNKELYPRLDTFIHGLSERGIHTMAYVAPHLSIEGRQYAEAATRGFLIKKPQGGHYIYDFGGLMAGLIDLSNPSARAWFKQIVIENILNLGFCGYFADMGDVLPADAVLSSGENPLLMRNRWPVMWAQLHREAIREAGRTMDTVFFTRSGWAGSGGQTMFATTGDHHTGWEQTGGLASALTASLSLACSGIGLSHSVCGGTSAALTRRSKEILLRWLDLAAFTPSMRVPVGRTGGWQVDSDAETLGHLVRMSRVHTELSSYIQALLKENASAGQPVMRPVFMNYPHDPAQLKVQDCYMLGTELFVAPVLRRGQKERKLRLPEGSWIHLWNARTFQGGEITVSTPFGKPPVFFRSNGKYHDFFRDFARKI